MYATTHYRGPLSRRPPSQRVGVYSRFSLYTLFVLNPYLTVLGVVGFGTRVAVAGIAAVAASLAVCVASILMLRHGVRWYLGGPRPPAAIVGGIVVSVAAGIATALWAFPARTTDVSLFDGDWRVACLALDLLCLVVACVPFLIMRWIVLAAVTVTAVVVAATVPAPGSGLDPAMTWGIAVGTAFSMLLLGITMGIVARLSVWMIGVVDELDRTRVAHAQLAVAEERLRFSRDLHDVFGRTLSVVAVKSELAAELSSRGRGGAAEEMLEVREIAQDALREVREVVAGYRAADLGSELAGARSVLRSAGITTTLRGADAVVPPTVTEALAWVVREGTTNVVRHSDATWCTIQLSVVVDTATLEIVNDGARPAGAPGTGLVGLTERLAGIGGTLSTWADGDRFGLVAAVPCASQSLAPAPTDEGKMP